jgi:hypothetical protein
MLAHGPHLGPSFVISKQVAVGYQNRWLWDIKADGWLPAGHQLAGLPAGLVAGGWRATSGLPAGHPSAAPSATSPHPAGHQPALWGGLLT